MATTEVVRSGEEAIDLKIETDFEGQVHASARLTWCVPEESRRRLENLELRDPHLFVVVECDGDVMSRYCVPLDDPFLFVGFHRAGKNIVHATIVGREPGEKSVKKAMSEDAKLLEADHSAAERLREEGQRIRSRIREMKSQGLGLGDEFVRLGARLDQINAEKEAIFDAPVQSRCLTVKMFNVIASGLVAKTRVEVAEDFFGKSWRITKFLGGIYGWEKEPRDQCHLRKRASITVATSPAAIPLTLALSAATLVVALWMLFWGYRTISWRSVIHPYQDDFIDAWRDRGESRWAYAEVESQFGGKIDVKRPAWQICLTPYGFVPVALVLGILAIVFNVTLTLVVFGAAIAGLVSSALLALLVSVVSAFVARRRPAEDPAEVARRQREHAEQRHKEELAEYQRLVASLSCEQRPSLDESLLHVLRERPSVRLAYKAAKGKVCKPFQR